MSARDPRKHPVWAATFGAVYARYLNIEHGPRLAEAIDEANTAVTQLLAHERAELAEVLGGPDEPSDEEKATATVNDLLRMISLYSGYPLQSRGNMGIVLDVIERFDASVARQLREGDDAAALLSEREEERAGG